MRIRPCIALSLLFLTPATVNAQTNPYGECRAGYWSSNRNLDDVENIEKATCFVNWRTSLSEQARLGISGRVGYGDTASGSSWGGRLREGFLEAETGPWTFRLGRQIIAWGRADRVNPTDNLSPRDFTLQVPEDEEQRIGINAMLGRYQFNNGVSLTAVMVPEFEGHKVPTGPFPPNAIQPSSPRKSEWALKIDRSAEGFDWSVSYFDGYDRFSSYWVETTGPKSFLFRGTYERMQTLGADFSTTVSDWSVRGEAAISRFHAECGACDIEDHRTYRLVFGIDRDVGDTANVNLQLFTIRRNRFLDPGSLPVEFQPAGYGLNRLNSQFGRQETGMTFRISDRYLNERLKLELGGIVDLTNHGGLIRPRLTYAFNDSTKVLAGIDHFYGKDTSFFGARKKNQTIFGEIAFVF